VTQEEQRQVVALHRTVGKHVDVLFQIVYPCWRWLPEVR
jgi:hypothetical protein